MGKHEFAGQKVDGNICGRCNKEVKWVWIPDSLAQFCDECGFVRVETGNGWEAGATIQEWLNDVYGTPKDNNKEGEKQNG